jgi:hypothetical protein
LFMMISASVGSCSFLWGNFPFFTETWRISVSR